MKISSIMTKRVVTVGMDDSLRKIAEIFSKTKFHHVLVIEDNKLCGVISDRDLLKASSPFLYSLSELPRDLETLNKKAHKMMSTKPITVTKETNLNDAVELLLQKNISCLPVTSPDGQIEGIVTWKDLIMAYLKKLDAA
ncbi:CBS domain-containing protein [Thermodesulfobacteriota bacterium]